jgi:hypothetical protein
LVDPTHNGNRIELLSPIVGTLRRKHNVWNPLIGEFGAISNQRKQGIGRGIGIMFWLNCKKQNHCITFGFWSFWKHVKLLQLPKRFCSTLPADLWARWFVSGRFEADMVTRFRWTIEQ